MQSAFRKSKEDCLRFTKLPALRCTKIIPDLVSGRLIRAAIGLLENLGMKVKMFTLTA